MRKTPLFLVLMLLAGAARADTVCHYASGNIPLDKSDFERIMQNDKKVTFEYFGKLAVGSTQRVQICDSRAIIRKVKSDKITNADFTKNFSHWISDYWGSAPISPEQKSEQDMVLDAQLNLATSSWAYLFEQGLRAS